MSDHEHIWIKRAHWRPISDGYGHLFYPEMTLCSVCGREKTGWTGMVIFLVWLAAMIIIWTCMLLFVD